MTRRSGRGEVRGLYEVTSGRGVERVCARTVTHATEPAARRAPAAWRPAARGRLGVAPPTPRRLAAALGGRLPPRGARIGLLGGSFNPAHGGHRRISRAALERLGLDEVWWLVSPQNPLKPKAGMAPLESRLATAQGIIAGHPRLRATAVEGTLGTLYTADTIAALLGAVDTLESDLEDAEEWSDLEVAEQLDREGFYDRLLEKF